MSSHLTDRYVGGEAGRGSLLHTVLIDLIKSEVLTIEEAVVVARSVTYCCITRDQDPSVQDALGTFFIEVGAALVASR